MSQPEYRWRRLTPKQRAELLAWRRALSLSKWLPSSVTRNARPHQSHLPRLERKCYQGPAFVHWTLTLEERATGWLSEAFHQRFRELMLHTAAREDIFCPAWCLMPDPIHLVWMGTGTGSDPPNPETVRGLTTDYTDATDGRR